MPNKKPFKKKVKPKLPEKHKPLPVETKKRIIAENMLLRKRIQKISELSKQCNQIRLSFMGIDKKIPPIFTEALEQQIAEISYFSYYPQSTGIEEHQNVFDSILLSIIKNKTKTKPQDYAYHLIDNLGESLTRIVSHLRENEKLLQTS